MSFLEVRNLGRRFGAVAALDGIVLDVARGSRTAVVGPSGSGKSTLLRILAGIEAPDTGQVRLDGQVLADGPATVPAHRRGIGLMAQEGALFPHLTVADNIGFGVPRRSAGRAAWIQELADMVEISAAMLSRRPDALSGGQQQRVALARALACRPRLMLLDEPFSALDTGLRDSTRRAVAALLGRTGMTTILVTHDQTEAMSFADQVAVISNGRLLQAGPPASLYRHPCSEAVARFLGDAVILPATVAGGWADCALGAVPVDAAAPDGPARLLLRPEQLGVARADGSAEQAGVVDAVEFAGAACLLTIRLRCRPGPPGPGQLVVRVAQNTAPATGEAVAIRVAGQGHVLGL